MQTCNMVQAGYGEADITPDNPLRWWDFTVRITVPGA